MYYGREGKYVCFPDVCQMTIFFVLTTAKMNQKHLNTNASGSFPYVNFSSRILFDNSCSEALHAHRYCGAEHSPAQPPSSLSVSNCCFIRAWKRSPWLHLIKQIGMADPHNQSQSLSNMLHSVTTKLVWRKVNYGPSPCSSAAVAVILYCFCSCCRYANMASLFLLMHPFTVFSFNATCSCMIHNVPYLG